MEKHSMKFHLRPALAAALAAALLVGGMGAAYAADVGGIRETLRLWIHGEPVEVTVKGEAPGSYQFSYTDEEGQQVSFGGGGVAIDDDGTQRPLSPEEVAQQFDGYVDDGKDLRVRIHDGDKTFDITDLLSEGTCKVTFEVEGQRVYYDIEDNGGGGWAYSRTAEPQGQVSDYIELD